MKNKKATEKTTATDNDAESRAAANVGGILSGLGAILEKLDELAQSGETLGKTGEFSIGGGRAKGIFGFTVKTGIGGEGPKVEPFGNIGADKASGKAVVREVREPAVDVFEEGGKLQIVLEMPGVGAEDVKLETKDDVLTISAEKGDKKYHKEILLPRIYPREKMTLTCNNGVFQITCEK